jgi:hypothetical protein
MGTPRIMQRGLTMGFNKTLKAACKHASQLCFERGVLLRMRSLMAEPQPRKRGR